MAGIFDFMWEMKAILKRNYAPFPFLTLSMLRYRAKKKKNMDANLQKEMDEIMEDVKRGKVHEISIEMRKFINDALRELGTVDFLVKGEERIEMNLALRLGNLYSAFSKINDAKMKDRVKKIVNRVEFFSKMRLNELYRVKKGGRLLFNAPGALDNDVGECDNMAAEAAKRMKGHLVVIRDSIGSMMFAIDKFKRTKDPKLQESMDKSMELVENHLGPFLNEMKLHHQVSLRLFMFLKDDVDMEIQQLRSLKQTIPLGKAERQRQLLEQLLDKAIRVSAKIIKKTDEETGMAQELINKEERIAA